MSCGVMVGFFTTRRAEGRGREAERESERERQTAREQSESRGGVAEGETQ